MYALFWKLFGAFWLTTVVILAVSIFVSFRLADGQSPYRLPDPRETDVLLQDILQESGRKGLEDYVRDPGNFRAGQTVYLIDRTGRDLLGRPVPGRFAARAQRVWALHERHARRTHGGLPPARRGRPNLLETDDGQMLLAMPGPLPPARFGILSSGNVRWTVLGLAAAISLLSFWLLSRSLTRPVGRISTTAARLAEGDLTARVGASAYTGDEIGRLAGQFDRMAKELETQSRTRHELFRNIAHELRAPLTRLQIATELLDRQPERADEQLERIRYEIERVENLTRQVLALARAEQTPDFGESTTLNDVIALVVSDAGFEANAHNVRLQYSAPANEIQVKGDPAAIASAIENVVRNAVQITPAGGDVTIIIDGASPCTVTVSDTGPGVADDQLEKIFEPFYRIDTNRPGAGIGLAITSRVLQQVGGQLSAANRPGGGLSIMMRFPLAG